MIAMVAFALLSGVILGQRFAVLSLFPATGFWIAAVIAEAMYRSWDVDLAMVTLLTATVAIQLGYFAGCGLKEWQR